MAPSVFSAAFGGCPRVAPVQGSSAAVPAGRREPAASGRLSSSCQLSAQSLRSSPALQPAIGGCLLRLSAVKVVFTAAPVRRHLSRALRVAFILQSGPVYTCKVRPEVRNGLATASWAEGWELAVPQREGPGAVLRLELQAVGMFGRTTTLSFMSIDLSEIPSEDLVQHHIDFGFGTLTAELRLKRAPNPLTPCCSTTPSLVLQNSRL
eukprot:RCo034408